MAFGILLNEKPIRKLEEEISLFVEDKLTPMAFENLTSNKLAS